MDIFFKNSRGRGGDSDSECLFSENPQEVDNQNNFI
jgi:hypothetical protein